MSQDWKQIKLGEVCKINDKNINKDFKFNDITYLDISSVGSGDAQLDNVVSIKEAPSRAKRIPIKGDSIIATVRPGNKTYSYLSDFPENTVVSTGFAVLTPIRDKIDSRYLYYIISENSFTSYLVSVEKGANYPAVSAKDISEAKVTIPPLKTQRKIASILSAYDDLIENNLKRIKLLEEQAQQTYEEWFVRFKFPGYEDVEIDEVSGLPFGWEIARLDKFADFKYGKMPKKGMLTETGFPVYSGYRVTGYCNGYLFENPTLIIVARGVGGTGDVKIAPAKCWLTNLSIAVLVNDDIKQSYLYYHLKDSNLRSLDSGAAQSQITITSLEPYSIKVPNIELQERFDIYYTKIFTMVLNLQKQNQHLKEARDILLPRLMSGMIDVDGLEVDAGLGMVAEEREKYN
ncbi:restriction endonuclease subunit S [Lacinutrix chionoecetis]